MHVKDERQHKQNLRELGRFGGVIVVYFAAIYLAAYVNIAMYPMRLPWFIIVIIVGGFFVVPRARRVMRAFEDNAQS